MRRFPLVLMYHYVRPSSSSQPGYHALDIDAFDAQLEHVARRHTAVGWPEVRDALDGRGTLPDDAVLLTFDDGLVDHHRWVLPRLAARAVPGVFFVLAREPGDALAVGHALHVLVAALGVGTAREAVIDRLPPPVRLRHATLEAARVAADPTDPDDAWRRPLQRELARDAGPAIDDLVSRHVGPSPDIAASVYLAPAQLNDLVAAGMTLGGHGVTHPWLDAITVPAARAEVRGSAAWLARRGVSRPAFAYPYGGVPPAAGRLIGPPGFRAGFTTRSRHDGRYRIGRIDADDATAVDRALSGTGGPS
jgi:peptidoglycan/xylan/chitin deacetylase (PgdA/CDA1 family)